MKTAQRRREARLSNNGNKGMIMDNLTEAIGWFSSFVLVLTIGRQVLKQYREGSSEGVSKWLFIGQMTASGGFLLYSWLVKNWVFVVTNGLMLLNGLAGLMIVQHHRRKEQKAGGARKAGTPSARNLESERA